MASYNGSTEQLEFKGEIDAPKKRLHIVLGLCAFFATLSLIFIILYATAANKSAAPVATKAGSQGGGKVVQSTQKPKQTTNAKPTTGKKITTASQAPTTKMPTGPFTNIRLPKNVTPYHYNVELTVDLKAGTFKGVSTAFVTITAPTEYVIIHIANMVVKKAEVHKDGTALKVKKMFEYKTNQYYVFQMESSLTSGNYSLYFEYDAKLAGDLKGLYKSTYKRQNGKQVTIAATQFQPTDARRAFPCFDEPALKATFNITLVHDPSFIALSNMPIVSTTTKGGLKADHFQKTVKMPTYLLAFVVCDFGKRSMKSTSNVAMTYYAPVDQVDQLEYSADIGTKILPYFEKYYNISYPLPKADMIAIPDFAAGAMENWGLITYRETALLYSPGRSSESNKQRVAIVVSHELVHQWFGNLVTNEWWSDLWLNEGFASYVEYFGVNHVEPSWRMIEYFGVGHVEETWKMEFWNEWKMEQIVINDQASAFAADALVTSHPIYVPVSHPNEINEIFDSISYQKGCSILMMLDHFLTNAVFRKGLNSYLNKYSFGNARTEDLWNSLTEASNATPNKYNVAAIMDTWTRQMGYPVVNISKDGTITQKRFLLDPNPDYSKEKYNSSYGYVWQIPIQYSLCDKTTGNCVVQPMKWLKSKSGSLGSSVGNNKWIKGNAGQYGFYRVTYDTEGWNDIIKQMNKNHTVLEPKDRAGILGDAFALARASLLDYRQTLNLFDYIHNETDYIPWSAASTGISYLGSLFSKTSKAGRNYPKYILKKIQPLYNSLGFKQSPDNSSTKHLDTYLRSVILGKACGNGMTQCLEKATEYFKKWMKDPLKNPVPADLRSLVYFYGILNGGKAEWDFAFKQYQNTTLGTERIKLLYGMSAIQEPWMIERYLNYSLDDNKVKSQDTSYIFSYISNYNPIGRYYAWYFLKDKWDLIQAKFGGGFFAMRRIFSSVTSGFKTDFELKQFDAFVSTLKNTGTATRTITQSRERIKANIDWLKRNEKTIADWLEGKAK